jgi:hypothetical protein
MAGMVVNNPAVPGEHDVNPALPREHDAVVVLVCLPLGVGMGEVGKTMPPFWKASRNGALTVCV